MPRPVVGGLEPVSPVAAVAVPVAEAVAEAAVAAEACGGCYNSNKTQNKSVGRDIPTVVQEAAVAAEAVASETCDIITFYRTNFASKSISGKPHRGLRIRVRRSHDHRILY